MCKLPTTLCISNGGQRAKNETNMNKINGSAKMKVSAASPATTHTHNRSGTFATSFISAWNHKNPAGLRGIAYKPFSGVKVNGNILNKGRTGLPLAYRKPSRYRKRPSMFTAGEHRLSFE